MKVQAGFHSHRSGFIATDMIDINHAETWFLCWQDRFNIHNVFSFNDELYNRDDLVPIILWPHQIDRAIGRVLRPSERCATMPRRDGGRDIE
jgi:hypothetical protein